MSGKTVVIDYGVGNLFSLLSGLRYIGEDAVVSANKEEILNADRLILPGVGAFRDAAQKLNMTGMATLVKQQADNGVPLLGICLGMQLLFTDSYEHGHYEGLNIIPGSVLPLSERINSDLKIPHMGWNKLNCKNDSLFSLCEEAPYAYYVHSFSAHTDDKYVIATSQYGINVVGAVRKDNVVGTQFHPEKSGKNGLLMLEAFCKE